MTDRPDDALDDFELDIRYDIGDSSASVASARRARAEAEQAERASADALRQAVTELPASLSVRDVAALLGVSYQRIAQVRAETNRSGRPAGSRHQSASG